MPVASGFKASVCSHSLAEITGSNPAGSMDVSLFGVCVLSGRGPCDGMINRPEECDVSEYDREASIMRRPWPTRGCCAMEKKVS